LVFAAPVIITVDTAADENGTDPAKCSLREAITTINSGSAFGGCTFGDTINFALGTGTPSIAITASLPIAVKPLVIDGNSGGATRIELNGIGAGTNASGLIIAGGSSIIKSLVINRFGKQGISLSTNGDNTVTDCYIGLDSTGTTEQPNGDSGIFINNTANNTIGGATPAARNVIASNGQQWRQRHRAQWGKRHRQHRARQLYRHRRHRYGRLGQHPLWCFSRQCGR
jgi:CSLREA domain-containing protein